MVGSLVAVLLCEGIELGGCDSSFFAFCVGVSVDVAVEGELVAELYFSMMGAAVGIKEGGNDICVEPEASVVVTVVVVVVVVAVVV